MKPSYYETIYLFLFLFTSYSLYAQDNVTEKNIDSIVNHINNQKLQIRKTIKSDSTEAKYDFVDTYYSDSVHKLVLFLSKNSSKFDSGRKVHFREASYYFHNDTLIKLVLVQTITGYYPNSTSYYFYKGVKYPGKEKRFRSYMVGKEKSILETFEK